MASSGTAVVTLPSETEILITREFDAPRHLVYEAWTIPELIKRWWAGKRGEVTVAEVDLRVGGAWRYAMTTSEGFEIAFNGEFSEVVPNERLAFTEIFEGMPGAEVHPGEAGNNVATFTEAGGRTTLELLSSYPSREIRDMVIDSGMEGGMQEGWDEMERIAISLG